MSGDYLATRSLKPYRDWVMLVIELVMARQSDVDPHKALVCV